MNREVFQFGCIVLLFSGTQYICGFLTFFFFFLFFIIFSMHCIDIRLHMG